MSVFALIEGDSVRNSRVRGGTAISALCSDWSRGYFIIKYLEKELL